MQINSRSVFEIGFRFDRVHRPVAPWAAVWLSSPAGAGVRCWCSLEMATINRPYDSISICVLFIAHCACLCMFLLQFTYNVWACVGVFALSAMLFLYCVIVCVRACDGGARVCVWTSYPRSACYHSPRLIMLRIT